MCEHAIIERLSSIQGGAGGQGADNVLSDVISVNCRYPTGLSTFVPVVDLDHEY